MSEASYVIEVYPRFTLRGRRWFFRIRAANRQIVAQSEGYRNKADCRMTAARLRNSLIEAEIVEIVYA